MATQGEIEQLRMQFKKEQKKRDRLNALVFGLIAMVALGMQVYAVVQQVETEKKLIINERDHTLEMAAVQREGVNCNNEIARLQNELTQCKK